jgi:hypothetical protein
VIPVKSEATPRPWRVLNTNGLVIESGDGNIGLMNLARPSAESEANAALIVECVNSHSALLAQNAELVKALERGLEERALNCNFHAQADDDAICCCGKARAYHWKADARAALAGVTK